MCFMFQASCSKIVMEIPDIFHNYLKIGVSRRASDIHLIAGQPPAAKIEGELERLAHEDIDPQNLAEFVFGMIPTDEIRERVAQGKEADIIYSYGGNRFRTNIHLQQGMFALSIRIISSVIPTPQFLGFHPTIYKFSQLKKGLVLLTGSTASGKSSVIASVINMINQEKKAHIITIEDPIEFVYPKKLSVVEQRQIGLDSPSFYDALRAAFRQDPDVIMIGEIRDNETAGLGIHAALTGHIVLSTLHTNNAIGVIPRLVDMKIEPFLLPSSLNLMMAQRLVSKLCQQCKKAEKPPIEIQEIIKKELEKMPKMSDRQAADYQIYHSFGCQACKGKGVSGRIALFEILEMTPQMREIVGSGAMGTKIFEESKRQGMITLRQDGILKALDGLISIEDVLRETMEM